MSRHRLADALRTDGWHVQMAGRRFRRALHRIWVQGPISFVLSGWATRQPLMSGRGWRDPQPDRLTLKEHTPCHD